MSITEKEFMGKYKEYFEMFTSVPIEEFDVPINILVSVGENQLDEGEK
ncbi:MAG: hypothetical protein ACYDAP_00130 [Thermoplasmataceae archaeon]